MDKFQLLNWIDRARAAWARQWRDRQIYVRLQVGSSIALGTGFLFSVLLVAHALDPMQKLLTDWLFPLVTRQVVSQDVLIEIIMILLVSVLTGATVILIPFFPGTALVILYIAMYLGYAFSYFARGILEDPLYPLLAIVVTFVFTRVYRYLSVERQREFIVRLFRHSVAPELVDRVMSVFDNGTVPLQGTRRQVTVMYVDLRDLRILPEKLEASEMLKLLNHYVSHIVAIVFQQEGFITRQAGDTTLAAWNLVLDQPDHAIRAVHAALEIKSESRRLVKELLPDTRLDIGIGVATGIVVAGSIGSRRRAEFTIIGEVVTLAERMAMKVDRGVFIDPVTRELLGDEFDTKQVNPIRLRRKTDPHQVWEVIEPMELEEEPEEEMPVAEEI